jgi:hypothetical protein
MARRSVMTDGMFPGGRFQVLLDHRPAVFVRHDLRVAHAMALADGPLREMLMRRSTHRPTMMCARAVVGLRRMVRARAMMRRRVVMRYGPVPMCRPMVIRVVLPRCDGREMREWRRLFGRSRLRRRSLLRGKRRRCHIQREQHPHQRGTTHDLSPPARCRIAPLGSGGISSAREFSRADARSGRWDFGHQIEGSGLAWWARQGLNL